MSLSKSNLAAIQKAGNSVFVAAQTIEQTLLTQAESLTALMASSPFAAEAEQVLAQFRQLARVSQDLSSVEVRMREIYGVAQELARPEADVMLLPQVAHSRLEHSGESVSDVDAKPAKAGRSAKGSKRQSKTRAPKEKLPASAVPKTKLGVKKKRKGRSASELTPNDQKLLQFLVTALTADRWTHMPAPKMAEGAQLPLGSIGVSLKKLLDLGRIKRGAERGTYQRST